MSLNGYFKLISNLYQYKLLVMSYLPPPHTCINLFLFFLAFVNQQTYCQWFILYIRSMFSSLFISQAPIKNECSTYKYQHYNTNKHIFVLGKNKFIILFRSGN